MQVLVYNGKWGVGLNKIHNPEYLLEIHIVSFSILKCSQSWAAFSTAAVGPTVSIATPPIVIDLLISRNSACLVSAVYGMLSQSDSFMVGTDIASLTAFETRCLRSPVEGGAQTHCVNAAAIDATTHRI